MQAFELVHNRRDMLSDDFGQHGKFGADGGVFISKGRNVDESATGDVLELT